MPQEHNTSKKTLRRIQGQRVLASVEFKPSINRSLLGTSPPSLQMDKGRYPFCEMMNWPQTKDLEGSSHQLVGKHHHIAPSAKMRLFNIDKSSSTEIFLRLKSIFYPLSSTMQKSVNKLQNFKPAHIRQGILKHMSRSKCFRLSRTRKVIYRRNQQELTGTPNLPFKGLEKKSPNKPKPSPKPVYPSQLPRYLYLVDEILPQGALQSNPVSISDLPAARQAEVWKEKFENERKILEKKRHSFDEFRFAKNAELDVERARARYYQQRFETELAKNALQEQQLANILSQEEHPPANMHQSEVLHPENTTNADFELDSSNIEALFAVFKSSPQPQSSNSIPILSADTLHPLQSLKRETIDYSIDDSQVEDLIIFSEEDSSPEVIPEVSSHGTNKYSETMPAESGSSVESLTETPIQSLPRSEDNQEREVGQMPNSERNNRIRSTSFYADLQPRSNGYMLFAWEERNFVSGLLTDLEADIQKRKNKRRGIVFPNDFKLEEF